MTNLATSSLLDRSGLDRDAVRTENSRGHAGAHCGKVLDDDKAYRRYFIPPLSPASNLGQCEKVAGPINKVYWCRLFARANAPERDH